jgi:hypothetical protein
MTRMIPPTIHSSVQSHAERRMYEIIRDAPNTEHWVCLHSLGLASPIPTDLTPAQQPAADLVRAFNDWAQNDLDFTPAAVTHCSRQSLPDDPRELMRLIPEAHRTLFDQAAGPDFQTLNFTPAHTTETFDPTADILPPPEDSPAGQQAQSKATAYFNSHPITLIQATGTDTASDLNITLLIALDPQASQLFTFITALSD